MGEWISVADRLPEESDNIPSEWIPPGDGIMVIVAWATGELEIGSGLFDRNKWWTVNGKETHPPTHWMRFPKPPSITVDD